MNPIYIHDRLLPWGRFQSTAWVVQMNLKKNTHPKSKEPKVSALRTHLYPSRRDNPVGLWMKPQPELRRTVHLKRTIITVVPNEHVRAPSCCCQESTEMCEGVWKVPGGVGGEPEKSESDIGAWFGSVMVAATCLCRLESELRTSHSVLHPLWEGGVGARGGAEGASSGAPTSD